MDDLQIWTTFIDALHADIDDEEEFERKKPLLAHYTSLQAVEKILETGELWFSNPLFMNDLDEVRFGIFHGARMLRESQSIKAALKTDARHDRFIQCLTNYIDYFEREHLLDTYVFCFSEHPLGNQVGILSTWRGYGANGNGAAIVFDTAKLTPVAETPLVIARVHYGSVEDRLAWIRNVERIFADLLLQHDVADEKLHLPAAAVFQRIKLFALFSKHIGFSEEREWRVVYLRERDNAGKLTHMLHYLNGSRGVEPKLRFKVAPVEGVTAPDLSFENLIAAILLGPTTSSPLAARSVSRMLDVIGRPVLKDRLIASTIPFRH